MRIAAFAFSLLAVLLLATGHAAAQRVNLAKFQSVSADSNSGDYYPIYAVDGVLGNDNRWISDSTGPHWLQIDFPIPFQFGSAHVFTGLNDGYPIANFSLQYYDGAAWVTFPGGSVSGNTATERNVVFTSPVTASKVRLYTTDTTARIKEIEFFSTEAASYPLGTDVRLDLAKQHLATASSVSSTNYARNAVDGFVADSSAWISTSGTGPHTLEIDLITTTTIGSAHLYCGLAGQSATVIPSFSLQYFDGTTWVNFSGGVVTGNTQLERQINFTTPASASKVRLLVSGSGPVRVRELAFFPANGGANYPLWTDVSLSAPPVQEAETYSDSFYKLVHRGDGLVLDSGTAGSALATTGTSYEQQYQVLLNVGTDTFRIRNRNSGLCLEPLAASRTSGAAVVESNYTGLPHQSWRLVSGTGGYVQIANVWSGMALDLATSGTAGGGVVQKTATSGTSQHWTITYVTNFPKKGLAGWTGDASRLKVSWHYNWGLNRPTTLPASVQFLPMQWGDYYYNTLPKYFPQWWGDGDATMFLGFNEPDHTDQSNMSVDTVLNRWPRLEMANVPQVSPAPANPLGTWMTDYMTRSDALGNRNDYVATHQYVSPSADGLITTLTNIHNAYGRPVLITEFAVKDWSGTATWTEEQVYTFFAEALWRLEGLTWLKRYAYYPYGNGARPATPQTPSGPTSYAFLPDGSLSPIGELYAAWDGDTTIRANTNYFIHNKSTHDRLLNPLSGSTPASADMDSRGGSAQWLLVSAPTAGRYYISAARDSRRLSWSGSALSLVAGSTTGASVEWRTTSYANGWYYIEHVSTGRRLNLNGATPATAASTTADDTVRWRFIKPYYVDGPNVAPILAPVGSYTISANLALTVPMSATDLDSPPQTLTYSLDAAPTGATIDPVSGLFAWTPTVAQAGGTNTVIVRVADNAVPSLSATQSFVVTVLPLNQPNQLVLRAGSVELNGVTLDSSNAARCIHILDDNPTLSDTATLISGNQYSSGGAMIHRSLLSFDLSPVGNLAGPASVTVQSAQVVLQSFSIDGTAMTHELRLTDPFGAGANWNTTDGTNAWPAAGGTLSTVLATNYVTTTGTKTWGSNTNLINAVALALSDTSQALYTILRAQGEWNGDARSQFRSATYTTNPDQRPQLLINFTLDAPLPALTWSGSATGTWNTTGTSADWNPSPAAYKEAGTAIVRRGNAVTFDDSATDFSVNLTSIVKPESLTLNNTANAFSISGTGSISGPTGLAKSGTHSLTLATANAFTGGVTISSGVLRITRPEALGSGAKTVTLRSGSDKLLELDGSTGNITLPPTISFLTSGINGVIRNTAGNNTIAGAFTMTDGNGNTRIISDGGALTLSGNISANISSRVLDLSGTSTAANTFSGVLSNTSTPALTKTGAGTWTLSGANTYGGATTVTAGTLKLAHDSALGSTAARTTVSTGARLQIEGVDLNIPENLTLGTGGTAGVTVENVSGNNTLSGAITRDGLLNFLSTAGRLTIQSAIGNTNNSVNLQGDGDGEISGAITLAYALNKSGNGTWTLSGPGTYTGATTISGGTLALSGSLAGSVAVNGGSFAPQGTPGVGGNLTVSGSGALQVRISGATAGSQYDQLAVSGTVALSGALNVTAGEGLVAGSSFTIINHTGPGAIAGVFIGKPNNSIFSSGGYSWGITYTGGDGNDVVLSIATALDSWRYTNFGKTGNSGTAADTADANADGENNLFEFATGQDPNAATTRPGTLVKNGASLEYTYTRNPSAIGAVSYIVEWSDSLAAGSWSSNLVSEQSLDDNKVKAFVPAGSGPKRFVRLRVTQP